MAVNVIEAMKTTFQPSVLICSCIIKLSRFHFNFAVKTSDPVSSKMNCHTQPLKPVFPRKKQQSFLRLRLFQWSA